MRLSLLCAALLAGTTLFTACSDKPSTTGPDTQATGLYTIQGKLKFNKPTVVPSDARVLVGWNVSSGSPDYIYMFGEGKVNMADSTYKVVFTKEPPAEALNSYGLGVGLVLMTTDKTIQEGIATDSQLEDTTHTLGIVNDYAVIFVKGSPDSVARGRAWAKEFKTGFNAGKINRQTTGFDTFSPSEPNVMEMILDYFENYKSMNWT